jgi:pimeloyl-ACP methyl ester carboxylesterase
MTTRLRSTIPMLVVAVSAGHAGAASAQSTILPLPADGFSGSELLKGKRVTEQECQSAGSAVWVVVAGHGECIRYYHSTAGGTANTALVYLVSDVLLTNERGESTPLAPYLRSTPSVMQNSSNSWSRGLRMPYLVLARPGTYGSSGSHAERRTPRETDAVTAALDAIKAVHGYQRLHLVGHSTGAHTAAALLSRRPDLGCVVLASGLLAVQHFLREAGRTQDATGNKNPVDPYASVGQIVNRADLQIFILTDPDDIVISARSQTAYAKRLAAAGLPVRQIFAAATDPGAHNLASGARRLAKDCAGGMTPEAIVARYQTKPPERDLEVAERPIHGVETLTRGVAISEPQCPVGGEALWVTVTGRGFCVKYWMSVAGGKGNEPLVYIHGDIGGTSAGKTYLNDYGKQLTSGQLHLHARSWSRRYRGPYIAIGRVGALGSSGHHLRDRRSLLEVRVIGAALEVLARKHGFKQFHLVGQSGGGHTVAVLAQTRSDIGCAVMTSGAIAVNALLRERGGAARSANSTYDPIDHVNAMTLRPGQRLLVLSDPKDRRVSYRAQREFVERVKAKGLPILHVNALANDKEHHGLSAQGLRLAIDCAAGLDDAALMAKHDKPTAASDDN